MNVQKMLLFAPIAVKKSKQKINQNPNPNIRQRKKNGVHIVLKKSKKMPLYVDIVAEIYWNPSLIM